MKEKLVRHASVRVAVVLFGPEGQGSFNESGLHGAQKAMAYGHEVDVRWVAPLDAQARAQAMEPLCAQGYDLIVAHGGQGDVPVALLSALYPAQAFVVTQGSYQAPNVARYEVLQEQSAFLAGVLAALTSKNKAVGHFSGEKVPPGLRGRAAFAHGLVEGGFEGVFATQFCGHQHQPSWAHECVAAMAQATSMDVLFAMIDGGRPGVSQACREHAVWQIGNVLNWVERDPEVFLASAICDSGAVIAQAVEDFAQGNLVLGGCQRFGLERPDLVRLEIAPWVSDEMKQIVAQWQQRILEGSVSIQEHYKGIEYPLPKCAQVLV
jgi:basic membrane protein A and related proteins